MNWTLAIALAGLLLSLTTAFWTYFVTVQTQRAFVFIKQVQTFVLGDHLVVMPLWQNTGGTPTVALRNYVNWKSFAGVMPDNYAFPDLDGSGNVRTDDRGQAAFFIGPKGEQFAQKLGIPLSEIERARKGELHIYVYGWARYRDTFPFTSEHITRFCHEIEITGIEINDQTRVVTAGIQFRLHDKNNCVDGDCK